jgi:hypothetical protein
VLFFQTLGHNQIIGTIPTELGELTSLTSLDLGEFETVLGGCNVGGDWLALM